MMLKMVRMMIMHMRDSCSLLLRLAACMEMVMLDDACMGMVLDDV